MPYTLTQEMRDIADITLLKTASFALSAYLFPGLCASVGLAAAIGASLGLGGYFIARGLESIGFDEDFSNLGGIFLSTYLAMCYFDIQMTSMFLMSLGNIPIIGVMDLMDSSFSQKMRDIAQNTLLEAAIFALSAYLFPGLCASVGLAAAIGASRYLGGYFISRGLVSMECEEGFSNFVGFGLSLYLAKCYFDIKMTSMILMMTGIFPIAFVYGFVSRAVEFNDLQNQTNFQPQNNL